MNGELGIFTTHELYDVDVRLSSGKDATLRIDQVQFRSAPHEKLLAFVHASNPVVQHFFAETGNGHIEIVHHPGLARNAGRAAEELALALVCGLSLGQHFHQVKKKTSAHGHPRMNPRTKAVGSFTYHPVRQVSDVAISYQRGSMLGGYAWEGIQDARSALGDLVDWLEGRPGQGYYAVEGGRPVGDPVIEHAIRFRDLHRV
ncbi:hypothetical protein ACIBAB_06020 [Streptomyces rubiginosohelvolus]|uniref:hypothetical protein n=1 Tax=Streptomyces rubiginosohelvolus TaxID=67362 RepID=UPI00378873C0